MSRRRRRHFTGGAGAFYGQKILTLQSANLLFDYPFSETSGTAAANAQGNTALNALYKNGVALNAGTFTDGTPYPFFDGVDDCVDAYTAALAAAINGNEGTFACWVLPDATVLASATSEYIVNLTEGVNNGLQLRKETTANQFSARRIVGGVTLAVTATMSNAVWTHFAMTWSVTFNRLRLYFSGGSVGTPQAAATMTLALGSTNAAIGAANNSGALRWKGGLKYPMLWTKELTAAEILSLATVP